MFQLLASSQSLTCVFHDGRGAGWEGVSLLMACLATEETEFSVESSQIAHKLVENVLPCRMHFEGLALALLSHSGKPLLNQALTPPHVELQMLCNFWTGKFNSCPDSTQDLK